MKTTSTERIDVDVAKAMMAKNPNNRNINKSYVKQLVRDMKRGTFQDNGDTIRIDEDGNLLDGQHRLQAVIDSGIPIEGQIVVRGLKPEVFATIDSGRQRTNADRLAVLGIKNPRAISSIARAYFHYEEGDYSYGSRVSDIDVMETAKSHTELFSRALVWARDMNRVLRGPMSVYASIIARGLEYDGEQTEEFCRGVISGAELKDGDSRLAFRKYMIGLMAAQQRVVRSAVGEMLRQALNAWLSTPQKNVAVLKFQKGSAFTPLFFAPVDPKKPKQRLMPELQDSGLVGL